MKRNWDEILVSRQVLSHCGEMTRWHGSRFLKENSSFLVILLFLLWFLWSISSFFSFFLPYSYFLRLFRIPDFIFKYDDSETHPQLLIYLGISLLSVLASLLISFMSEAPNFIIWITSLALKAPSNSLSRCWELYLPTRQLMLFSLGASEL